MNKTHEYYLDIAYQWKQVTEKVCALEDLCVDEPDMAHIFRQQLEVEYLKREMLEQELEENAEWAQWLDGEIKAELYARHRDRLANFLASKLESFVN